MKHLLGLEGLSAQQLTQILDSADKFREISERRRKKVPALRGTTVVLFFVEPSTRTRMSFELAAKRLSADTISLSASTSSLTKGETLVDTAKNLMAMHPDIIVLRHSAVGAPHLLTKYVDAAIVNAGDGPHEHPTQGLLDMLTIRRHKGRIKGLKIAIIGDILHSRVARSNIFGMTTLGAQVRVAGPRTMLPPGIADLGVEVFDHTSKAVKDVDVVMMLRVQKERFTEELIPSDREYFQQFGLDRTRLGLARPDCLVMHPGPMNRGVEIEPEVADGANSVILNQVANGVAVRMAVLFSLAATGDKELE